LTEPLILETVFFNFLIYAAGYLNLAGGIIILSSILLGRKLKLIPKWQAKEIVLSHFFKNWDIAEFTNIASNYARERWPRIIRDAEIRIIRGSVISADNIRYLQKLEKRACEECEKKFLQDALTGKEGRGWVSSGSKDHPDIIR
jgi:hypothetical protein